MHLESEGTGKQEFGAQHLQSIESTPLSGGYFGHVSWPAKLPTPLGWMKWTIENGKVVYIW